MEEGEPQVSSFKSLLAKSWVYVLIFALGFIFAGLFGGKDRIKETATLALETAENSFLPGTPKIAEEIPLKTAKTSALVKQTAPKKSASLPPPKPLPLPVGSSTTSSTEVEYIAPEEASVPMASSSPAAATSSSIATAASRPAILIYEVQIEGAGGNTAEDFIKLYNPSPYSADLGGWKIKKRSKTGSESSIRVIPDGTTVPSGGLLTWANSKDGWNSKLNAELYSTATISPDNSIALFDKEGVRVDALCWGAGVDQLCEGAPYSRNPLSGEILRRMRGGANLADTDNNASDFSI